MVYFVIWALLAVTLMLWKRWIGVLYLVASLVLCVVASGKTSAEVASKRNEITAPAASAVAALKDGAEKLSQ